MIVLQSQPNEAARNFILNEFPKTFPKIQVSLSVVGVPQFVARLRAERQTGNYLWDLGLAGPQGGFILAKDGMLDPILPELIYPDVKNPDIWGGWDEAFVDVQRKYVFAMARFIAGPWYNASVIPPEKVERQGLKTLLDPEYRGKIAWHDPTVIGSGTPFGYLMFVKLGEDGLKKLIVDQKIVFYAQHFQVVEAMARGTAWITMGPPVRSLIAPYTQAGAGVKTDIRTFGTGVDENFSSIGGSGLYVINRRPHPNATRVFINWLLSKDVQYEFAKAVSQGSRRVDVPSIAPEDQTPRRGVKYVVTQSEENENTMDQSQRLIGELRKLAQ